MLPPLPFILKKALTALLLPPAGLILLVLLGMGLSGRWPRFGKRLQKIGLFTLFCLALPLVSDTLLHMQESHPPITAPQLQQAQAIVILGGGMNYEAPEYGQQDTVGRWTLERLRYGAFLQRQGNLPLLVTGGAPSGGRPEAEAMQEVIVRDFRGQVRWVESASLDTEENARNAAAMLKAAGITRIALVSQAWHLPRAVRLFRQQGLEVFPAPTGFTVPARSWLFRLLPSPKALEDSCIALREWTGRLMLR